MKRLIAIVLGIALLSPTPARADVSAFVHFYPKLESYTLSAPITDSLNNNYTFPVTIWNHQKLIDQVHFKLYDCNNLGQDTEWVVFNYKDNWGISARGKDFYIGDITLNYSAWSRSGVGICTGNWNLKVIVVLINGVSMTSNSELKVARSDSVSSSMQKLIDEINAMTKAMEATSKALKENQRLQAEAKARAEREAYVIYMTEQERILRKFIGKPCKTLQAFKENDSGYIECVSKKGKKVWGNLSIYELQALEISSWLQVIP